MPSKSIMDRFEDSVCEDSKPTSSPEMQKFCNTPLKRKKGQLCKGKPGKDGLCWRHTQRQDDADQPIGGKFRVTETMRELRKIAKEEGVRGYSRKNKLDLVRLIESATTRKFKRREVFTRKQLKARARRMGITNFSRLKKDQLAEKVKQSIEETADQIEIEDKREAVGGIFGTVDIKPKTQLDVETFIRLSWGKIRNTISEGLAEKKGLKVEILLHVEMVRIIPATSENNYANPIFRSASRVILESSDLDEEIAQMEDKIKESMEAFNAKGSGWTFGHIEKLEIQLNEYKPLKGSSYIPLPKKLAAKKAIVNVKNEDQQCFKWAILSALHHEEVDQKSSHRVKQYEKWTDELRFDGIDFPASFRGIDRFEKLNEGIKVNVYGFDMGKEGGVYPMRISEKEDAGAKHVDLMLVANDETRHYCWVKNLSRLLTAQVSDHDGEAYFCRRCLNHFTRQEKLDQHIEYCGQKKAVKIEMPSEGSYISFQNHIRSMKVPFVVYADFECFTTKVQPEPAKSGVDRIMQMLEHFLELIKQKVEGGEPSKPHTKILQKHVPSGFCYHIKCFDETVYAKEPVIYTMQQEGEDVGQIFVDRLTKDIREIYQQNDFKKPMTMTEEDRIAFAEATKCSICDQELGEDRVRDHCHFTGRFRGAAHNECNLNYQAPKFIPIIFHNLAGYDAHLFIKALGAREGKIDCIPNTEERYISFTKSVAVGSYKDKKGKVKTLYQHLRFIDSFKFMGASLQKLVESTPAEAFTNMRREFGAKPMDPGLFKIGHFESENGRSITLREVIDREKLKYIVTHPEDYELGSRYIKGEKVDKDAQLTLLQDYLARTNALGECPMRYYQRHGFGRYWTGEKIGLQNISRRIRHTLCADHMIDIDMKNAHPTLLSWYCHENGIACTGLDAYIADRERLIADLMAYEGISRDDAKTYLLAIINGKTVRLKHDAPAWLRDYYGGMRQIMEEVIKLNPDLHKLACESKERKGTDYNIEGTTVNYVMCSLENKALMAAFDYLTEQEIEVGALVFDGLMIHKKGVPRTRLPEILQGCSQRVKEVVGADITFTVKEMDEGYDIPTAATGQKGYHSDLLLRKGVYPYDYMDSFERLQETQLPPKEVFFSTLTGEHISEEDYDHAQRVWEAFGCKTMRDYHDLYLETDVILLTDVFENFRKICMEHYGLDPAHYYTAPGLAYDAALKVSGIKLELLTDPDMMLMVEKGIRGGLTMVSQRYARANNPYMQDFDPSKPTNYLMYLDANNLYGWAMSRALPTGGFKWIDPSEVPDLSTLGEEDEQGYILEVDLEYPRELHDRHNDYPLAPESMVINGVRKLVANLHDKEKYVVHYVNLKKYLARGLKLKKIHRVLKFTQSPWLRAYVEKNTACRAAASTDFEKDFFKLMVNSVFGKTMENIRNRVDVRLVNSEKIARKLVAKPNFKRRTVFSEDLAAVHLHRTKLVFDKPIYLGFSILDISKTLMADFVYDYLKPRYGDRLSICYTDTDSLICDIQTVDVYKDMAESVQQCFDTSNYAPDHASGIQVGVNKKVLGKFKDECAGQPMTEYVGLRPKAYAFKVDREECKKAKGVKRSVVETNLTFADYKECLDTGKDKYRSMNIIRSRLHQILTLESCKKSLSSNDDKRYILPDGIHTLAHGHYRI